jgi:hypothetical protein
LDCDFCDEGGFEEQAVLERGLVGIISCFAVVFVAMTSLHSLVLRCLEVGFVTVEMAEWKDSASDSSLWWSIVFFVSH